MNKPVRARPMDIVITAEVMSVQIYPIDYRVPSLSHKGQEWKGSGKRKMRKEQ